MPGTVGRSLNAIGRETDWKEDTELRKKDWGVGVGVICLLEEEVKGSEWVAKYWRMWGAFWNSIQEEVWGTEHSGTKGGQVAEDRRRQRKLFGKRLEGWPEPVQGRLCGCQGAVWS